MTITVTHAKVDAIPDNAVDAAAGKVLPSDWNANHVVSGTVPAAGADTNVQFNDAGAFGGDVDFIWSKTEKTLTIDGSSAVGHTVSSPGDGLLTLTRFSATAGAALHPFVFVDTDDQGGVWNRFSDRFNSKIWQFGASNINGPGSGSAFWVFRETSTSAIDTGITHAAIYDDGTNSFIGLNAKGVVGWNGDAAYAGLSGAAGTGGSLNIAVSRVSDNILGIGNGTQGDFTGTAKLTNVNFADHVTLEGSTSTSTAWTMTLPPDSGVSGYLLKTNGSGVTSWTAPTTGAGLSVGGSAITGGTAGSLLFEGATNVLAEDNSNLFWDTSNKRLGIGNAAPANKIHATIGTPSGFSPPGYLAGVSLYLEGDAASGQGMGFIDNATNKRWFLFTQAGAAGFEFYNDDIGGDGFVTDLTTDAKGILCVNRDAILGWSNYVVPAFAVPADIDIALSRMEVKELGLGNGVPGDYSGALKLTTVRLAPVAIASLPGSPIAGDLATVNDALVPVIGSPVVSGGAAFALLCYNGANWNVVSI